MYLVTVTIVPTSEAADMSVEPGSVAAIFRRSTVPDDHVEHISVQRTGRLLRIGFFQLTGTREQAEATALGCARRVLSTDLTLHGWTAWL